MGNGQWRVGLSTDCLKQGQSRYLPVCLGAQQVEIGLCLGLLCLKQGRFGGHSLVVFCLGRGKDILGRFHRDFGGLDQLSIGFQGVISLGDLVGDLLMGRIKAEV